MSHPIPKGSTSNLTGFSTVPFQPGLLLRLPASTSTLWTFLGMWSLIVLHTEVTKPKYFHASTSGNGNQLLTHYQNQNQAFLFHIHKKLKLPVSYMIFIIKKTNDGRHHTKQQGKVEIRCKAMWNLKTGTRRESCFKGKFPKCFSCSLERPRTSQCQRKQGLVTTSSDKYQYVLKLVSQVSLSPYWF